MPPPSERRTPIEYECGACGAYNVAAIRFTRHRNQCKAVRIRVHRAYQKNLQLLWRKKRAKAERLASVTGEGSSKGPLIHTVLEVLPRLTLTPPYPIQIILTRSAHGHRDLCSRSFDFDPLPEGLGLLEAEAEGFLVPEVAAPTEDVDPQAPTFFLRRFLINNKPRIERRKFIDVLQGSHEGGMYYYATFP
ncbi:hypothetical protein CY34DRAFT_13158 [Suillus luteus UH-Slu-Lm8-n1]|uniref:Uncharacterized protein n=1 Tax=Suillus luteus UH-Slu-Lm8-n1 TaxID=930992 RepID=A0A0C9ZTL7_9AGAM|nr:hypothetical protein CY34DRAFT_13158 [Suillus luteus UH-Slu-Lm8-n1]